MSKLNYGIFQDYTRQNKCDILCLSETKLDEADEDNVSELLSDYSPMYKHRSEYERKSGGLATFFKKNIIQYCQEIHTQTECAQFFKIDKQILGYEFILASVYIPPDDSKYNKGDEYEALTEHLLDLSIANDLPICLVGDFNARTSKLTDLVILDEYVAESAGLTQDESTFFFNEEKLTELGVTSQRLNTDTKCNPNGYKLIELCKNTGVHIVNGRRGKDNTLGKLTCNDNNGKPSSTIDYAIMSASFFPNLKEFYVDDFDGLMSDKHCPINLRLSAIAGHKAQNTQKAPGKNSPTLKQRQVPHPPKENVHSGKPNHKVKWNPDLSNIYKESFNISAIEELDNKLNSYNDTISRVEMDKIADEICNLYFGPGIQVGMVRAQGNNGNKSMNQNSNNTRKKQPWFNAQCRNHRAMYHRARRLYTNNKTQELEANEKAQAKMYKKTINNAIKEFNDRLKTKLRNLKTTNPKEYWEILNSNSKEKISKIAVETFLEHFKKLNTVDSTNEDSDPNVNGSKNCPQHDNSALNYHFTEEEVRKVTSKLKSGKSGGMDQIVNEFLKNSPPQMVSLVTKYFNLILESGIIPTDWKIGVIIPIFKKKGSVEDPDNYRGITLLSCIGKLFTAVVNSRLNNFLEVNDLLGKEQAGFREGYSTLDHIFVLNAIVEMYLGKKKRIYAAFIDYKKAFDSIDRTALWSKLLHYGIEGKIYNIIQNLYVDAKSCIRVNNEISEYFSTCRGVRQGENLSPLLFSIYLNDLADYIREESRGIEVEATFNNIQFYIKLYVLLYADDTIILGETPEDLQDSLNSLDQYCKTWKLEINVSKSKVVIFSRGKVRKIQTWNLGDQVIETTDDYVYLGTTFNYNGRFEKALQKQAAQAKRAMYCMIGKARKLGLPVDIQIHLFNTLIQPILLYGSEIWGYNKLDIIERVQTSFYKQLLKLNGTTPHCTVLGEVGCVKMEDIVKNKMLNFWARLALGNQSKIAYSVYKVMRAKYESGEFKSQWLSKIHTMLNDIGLSNIWISDNPICAKWFKHSIQLKINDISVQNWRAEVESCGWCRCYKLMKSDRKLEKYLVDLNTKEAIALCKFRASNHKLPIVTGRFDKIKKEDRTCPLCSLNEVGDEFHYTFQCSYFNKERRTFLRPYYWNHKEPVMSHLLFQSEDTKELSNLAKLVAIIMEKFNKKSPN